MCGASDSKGTYLVRVEVIPHRHTRAVHVALAVAVVAGARGTFPFGAVGKGVVPLGVDAAGQVALPQPFPLTLPTDEESCSGYDE